jgi:hypothetical protein
MIGSHTAVTLSILSQAAEASDADKANAAAATRESNLFIKGNPKPGFRVIYSAGQIYLPDQ